MFGALDLIHIEGYDLVVEDLPDSFNTNTSISISRNRPLAVVVGAAGFLGSHLVDHLLSKNVQVIGIDNFSTGKRINLSEAGKNKDFHLIDKSVCDEGFLSSQLLGSVPRLDYAFFVAESDSDEAIFSKGVINFLEYIRMLRERFLSEIEEKHEDDKPKLKEREERLAEKPRIVMVSSVVLYDNKIPHNKRLVKEAEVRFAKFIKHYKLNARIVRLAGVYGPRMHFREEDPVARLIQASLQGRLNDEQTSADFTSRSLYVDDAVNLITKSSILGATAQKIFDGCLLSPIKVSEIKQVLLDPLWHESKGFSPTELPPWVTPNLERTVKELSWRPKTQLVEGLKNTIAYFKDNNVPIPEINIREGGDIFPENVKKWSFRSFYEEDKDELAEIKTEGGVDDKKVDHREDNNRDLKLNKWRKMMPAFIIGLIVFFGLIFPVGSIAFDALTIRSHLKSSQKALEGGDFETADGEIGRARVSIKEVRDLVSSMSILKRLGLFTDQISKLEETTLLIDEGIEGLSHAVKGSEALFKTTKVISGEDKSDPKPLYEEAQRELSSASQKISKVSAKLGDQNLTTPLPGFVKERVDDLSNKLNTSLSLVEKARSASYLMPEITGISSRKTYLVLLQNNLELRPGGGFIGSYGLVTFEKGRLVDIKVDDIYNLDGGLKDVIEPPVDLKNDLGVSRWYLRDSNYDPDFPTSARQAEFFFKKEAGGSVNGVIAMDLSASGKLLSAVGGLDLPDYGERVDGNNLFERAISHAEVNFFPGSQAKKNYLTSLQGQLFNKVFYLSKQNWPAIIQALGSSLEQKHLMVYLADPTLFSYLASSNWASVFPRGAENIDGQTSDFLAVIESNMGANKANYYLERSYKLDSSFTKEGVILHKLVINYKNNSPSEVFPAGKYKNRMRLYLPVGAKITKALWGEIDITSQITNFSDHGRAGFSMLLELVPKDKKALIIEYSLNKQLSFKDGQAVYRLDVFKQAGTDKDPFDWTVTYPINYEVVERPVGSSGGKQEIEILTDMQKDRSFQLTFKNK